MPLPPYIKRDDRAEDRDRYQTVFARARGSIAAPTAGLHFTPALTAGARRSRRRDRRDHPARRLRHLSAGSRRPRRGSPSSRPSATRSASATAAAINRARADGRRIIAVGTTTTRTLEAVARGARRRDRRRDRATPICSSIPARRFRIVGGLLTNFHLPQVVAADAGLGVRRPRRWSDPRIDAAIAERYRFYSYGDAMLIL